MSVRDRIDKAHFGAGLQCPKRMYLEYHEPRAEPAAGPARRAMAEAGERLVALARSAFPKGVDLTDAPIAEAATKTAELLRAGSATVLFGAAFQNDEAEARADVVLGDGKGNVELFEVKAGTKIKTRHVKDLAFQVWVVESTGLTVRATTVLHPDPKYRHGGGERYPVHELFRHADVSDKVRPHVAHVAERIAAFRGVLDDPLTRELPIGTWCTAPVPCPFFGACEAEASEHPLTELPGLTRAQELRLHEAGIEDLSSIPADTAELTPPQLRALRAVQQERMEVEPFVADELADVRGPVHFFDCASLLVVLPRHEGTRPWRQLPFGWAEAVVRDDGGIETRSFCDDGKGDPRAAFTQTVVDAARRAGTLVTYGPALRNRLREILEDLPEHKTAIRAVLHRDHLDLENLLRAGVYHPAQAGSFALTRVHAAIVGGQAFAGLEIDGDPALSAALQRLHASRTRAATRGKLQEAVQAYLERRAACVAELVRVLREHRPAPAPDEARGLSQ